MSNILKMEMITIYFNRKSIRLKYFDYSKNGMYYVTICTKNRECILSQIQNSIVGADDSVRPLNSNIFLKLTTIGEIVNNVWNEIPNIYNNVKLQSFIIMPNHIHGIIEIIDNGRTGSSAHYQYCKKYKLC